MNQAKNLCLSVIISGKLILSIEAETPGECLAWKGRGNLVLQESGVSLVPAALSLCYNSNLSVCLSSVPLHAQ